MPDGFLHSITHVKAFIIVADGVLTNGNQLLLENGERLRQMNVKDGHALELALDRHYRIAVIVEDESEALGKRLESLGVKNIYYNAYNRLAAMEKFLIDNETSIHEALFIGQDIQDKMAMKACGVAACPQDAAEEIKEVSQYISAARGGQGCVREVIQLVMKARGHWNF